MLKGIKSGEIFSLKNHLLASLVALLVGLIVGLVDTVFGRGLLLISAFRAERLPVLLPFLGLSGLLIVYLYQRFGGKAGKGMGQIFAVGQGEEDELPLILVPLIISTTWLTHLFGGSAGREGVAVQLGATISYYFSRFISFEKSSRLFLVMGMAAGFAGLFQTPIAAIFFALEVLVIGNLNLTFLLPVTVAAFTASWTSHSLGLEKFTHHIPESMELNFSSLVTFALLGLVFGLVGNLFAVSLSVVKKKIAELMKNPYHRILLGGLILSIFLWLCHQGRYSGLGTNLIDLSFSGAGIKAYDWLLKLGLTVFTLSLGFQGGEVTPLFSIGASLGVALAELFHLPVEIVAASGYIAVFGSATNTFLAPIFIGGEIFGFENLPIFFVAVVFSYIVNRKSSIYGGQKILVLD